MKNIYSNIFPYNKKSLNKTISILNNENIVSLPTETVYGLAGNAYSNKSIKKIYKLKKRPKINPLIIHFFNYNKAVNDVELNKNFFKLYKKFCPGPITFILKKKNKSKIQPLASANLKTIAVRFPSNKVIRSVLKKIDFPLAMPSANISSSISPVSAEDVADEFKNNIKFILDGGLSEIGIESTVIDLTSKPKILRPGIIELKTLRRTLKKKISITNKNSHIKSPGMLKRHYSPGIPIFLNQKKTELSDAFIVLGKKYKSQKNIFNLSQNSDLKEAAANLYKTLRKIKKKNFKKINIVKIPNKGPGIAINDRLKRAAKKK